MRRREREITDRAEIDDILNSSAVCRVGMLDEAGPYVVPVNFGYEDGRIWFHCAVEGRKIAALRRDPRVCVEVDLDSRVVTAARACEWTSKYRSVIAFGHAAIVEEQSEKLRGLDAIMHHYGHPGGDYNSASLARVLLVRVDIESISGKKSE